MCAAPPPRKAFVLIERLGGETLETYSYGNGRFIPGTPSAGTEVCFRIDKDESSLNILVHDISLLGWLRAIPLPNNNFNDVLSGVSFSIDTLLSCYPKMSAKFDQDRGEGRSFDALELFVHHFLREGSTFASFGFEHLRVNHNLTELHFHDIHSQKRSISDDLDLLDEAVDELDKEDVSFINEPFLSQLRVAIEQHLLIIVHYVLAVDPGSVDAKTLDLAIRNYDWGVLDLLLKRGAQVEGADFIAGYLYHAAIAGRMDAVQLLLEHGANIEGENSCSSATPLSGAASGGHMEIVQYLLEEKGANINGNGHKSPLSRAIKHRHTYIVDYLLRAGANVLEEDYLELLSQAVENKEIIYGDFLERSIAGMDNEARESLRSRAYSEGHFEIVHYLLLI
ncbi:hypothetical protein TGAMA5MH_01255 [Trichoderma gamsii]|uniref:Uncharacterized protein n=1 Tax=Trichoderma gamsii TaxID=398673 RepID=A0A2K0TPH6_9HYPO|nr:hypothetical protein TGAMA5MH_01255 [Trichoderma gamsii]